MRTTTGEVRMIGRRVTPSMVVAVVALFAALGGSAFAVGNRSAKLGCTAGAAKAYITVDVEHFVGSFPQSFSSSPKLFARRYSCNGRAPEARGTPNGIEIRFPGLAAGAPVVGTLASTGGFASVSITNEGVYRIQTFDPGGNPTSRGFTLVIL
jgi:hypothetical protein